MREISIFGKLFKGKSENKDKFQSVSTINRTAAPVRNKDELLKLYGNSPFLYDAVKRNSNRCAGAKLYVADGENKNYNHEFVKLLNSPNPLLSGYNVKFATHAWLQITGECIWLLERGINNKITAIYPVGSNDIIQLPFAGYPFYKLRIGNQQLDVPVTEIVYFKELDLYNIYGRGVGSAQALNDELSISELSGKQINQYFYNDATPQFLIGMKGVGNDEAKRVKENWLSSNQGWTKKYLPHFIGATDFMVQKLSDSFKDTELNAMRLQEKEIIYEFFGIPPELRGQSTTGDKSSKYIAESNYISNQIEPMMNQFVDTLNTWLMYEYGSGLLGYDSLSPRDIENQKDMMARFPYAFKINEVRQLAGYEEVPEGDKYPIPFGITFEDSINTNTPQEVTQLSYKAIKSVVASDLLNIVNKIAFTNLWKSIVSPAYIKLIEDVGSEAYSDFRNVGKFDIHNPHVTTYINNDVGNKIKGINETLVAILKDTMINGYDTDLSMYDLQKELESVFMGYKNGYELERIVRTETMSTTNAATLQGYSQTGAEGKEWIATNDDRTRTSHIEADGQKVKMEDEFTLGSGVQTQAPGNSGVAEEDINCRCTLIATTLEKSMNDEQRKQYAIKKDKQAVSYEKLFKSVYRKYFEAIEKQVITELNKL